MKKSFKSNSIKMGAAAAVFFIAVVTMTPPADAAPKRKKACASALTNGDVMDRLTALKQVVARWESSYSEILVDVPGYRKKASVIADLTIIQSLKISLKEIESNLSAARLTEQIEELETLVSYNKGEIESNIHVGQLLAGPRYEDQSKIPAPRGRQNPSRPMKRETFSSDIDGFLSDIPIHEQSSREETSANLPPPPPPPQDFDYRNYLGWPPVDKP